MKAEQLQSLNDSELQEIIKQAGEILKERENTKKQKAIEDAKAKLASVGLTFRDVAAPKAKAKNKPLPQGQKYTNPADASQTYTTGRGRPPKWFADLHAKGNLPEPSKK